MTGLVSRVEKRGLVQRTPSPRDGRAILVSLTEHGRRRTDQGAAEIGDRITRLTARLTVIQRTRLTELASALVGAHQ